MLKLDKAPDDELRGRIEARPGLYMPLDEVKDQPVFLIRQVIAAGRGDGLVIDRQSQDGRRHQLRRAHRHTSVVAQMLEANPELTPQQVKLILVQTARRLPNVEVDKQGWSALEPQSAVQRALELRQKPKVDATKLWL